MDAIAAGALALFAPWGMLPYFVMASTAKLNEHRPGTVLVLFFVNIFSAAACLWADYHLLQYIHWERETRIPGEMNCAPAVFIVGFWLIVLPLVQLVLVVATLLITKIGRLILTMKW
jgi:hypothetical protein